MSRRSNNGSILHGSLLVRHVPVEGPAQPLLVGSAMRVRRRKFRKRYDIGPVFLGPLY
jgi:hypothetical protein